MQSWQQLPLSSLLYIVETNESLYGLVETAVKEKFKNKEVVLHRPYYDIQNKPKVFLKETSTQIIIYYLPVVKQVLRYFGHLVVNLRIFNRPFLSPKQFKEIYQHVNAYCTASVTELHLTNIYKGTFVVLKPFPNVTKLTIDGQKDVMEPSAMALSELFPVVRQLVVDSSPTVWMYLSDQKMANLEYFYTENVNDYFTPWIKEMLKNNPQIKSLAIKSVRPDLLQFIATESQQLERLTLYEYGLNYGMIKDVQNVSMHFESVKAFVVKGRYLMWLPNITFGKDFEEFEINHVLDGDRSKIVDFVGKHKESLKKLHLDLSLENFDILQFASACVEEMSFTCKKESDIDSFISLIENCEGLKRFELFVEQPNFRGTAFDTLKNRFDQKWNVTNSDYCVYLERK